MPIPRIEAGQFVKFTYRPPVRPVRPAAQRMQQVQQYDANGRLVTKEVPMAPRAPEPPSDPSKEVFVLHPHWQNQVHGIDMKRVTPAEQQVLHAIMDPANGEAVKAGRWPIDGVPNYPLIRDTLLRMQPTELIKNPLGFYAQFVKPFIRNKDVYRRYNPQYMFGLQVVQESRVTGPVTNPAPLFKKI